MRSVLAVAFFLICVAWLPASGQQLPGAAAHALTWQQIRDKFEAANPSLRAGQIGIDESRATEISAYLRPNPGLTLSTDGTQISRYKGVWRPFSGTQFSTNLSYLHERQRKRELRLESAQKATGIAVTGQADLERTLLFTLRMAFVQTLQEKAVLDLAKENLAYYDHVLDVNRERYKAGAIAQVDLDRLELQRVTYEADLQIAEENLETAKIQLLILVNDRTPVALFDVTGPFGFSAQIAPLEDVRQTALATRPERNGHHRFFQHRVLRGFEAQGKVAACIPGDKERLIAAMQRELDKIPGVIWNFSQPIADNMEEAVSGVKGQLATKVYGDDLKVLEEKADQVLNVMRQVKGIEDLGVFRALGQPNIEVQVDRLQVSRHQINVADVQDAIQTAVGGAAFTQVLQGEQRYDLVLRYLPQFRNSKEAIENIRLLAPSGERVSLAQLCTIQERDGGSEIYREGNQRFVAIKYSVRGRDLGGAVEEAIQKVNAQIQLPRGYRIDWEGEYESEKRAEARLLVIVPLTILWAFFPPRFPTKSVPTRSAPLPLSSSEA